MKLILIVALGLFTQNALMAKDTLASKVYSWANAPVVKSKTGESRKIMEGSTLDNKRLEVHTSLLQPGQTNHSAMAYNDKEELVIIKEGELNLSVNGQAKTLGPGGLALIVAGDKQSFTNLSGQPVTYYVISYTAKAPVQIERGQQGGGSFMKDWKEFEVKQTDKGESRPMFNRPSSMFPRFDVHATALNPGISSHAAHTHRVEEFILMIKGNGEMQIGDNFHKATVGDVIFVNANVPHAITNTGSQQCGYFAIQWHDN